MYDSYTLVSSNTENVFFPDKAGKCQFWWILWKFVRNSCEPPCCGINPIHKNKSNKDLLDEINMPTSCSFLKSLICFAEVWTEYLWMGLRNMRGRHYSVTAFKIFKCYSMRYFKILNTWVIWKELIEIFNNNRFRNLWDFFFSRPSINYQD